MQQLRETAYRPDIDGLRCIAILTVVLSHAEVAGFSGGYVGVDVFFVISGFLITRILWADLGDYPRSLIAFYDRRARRILPALTVAVLATIAAGLVILGPGQLEELARSAVATTFFLSNVWFWITSSGYFGPGVHDAPLLHTWSLAVEEQFYIFFPLLLAGLAWASRRLVRPVLAVGCVASLAAAAVAVAAGHEETAFFLLPTRAWELGIGGLLALGRVPVPADRRFTEPAALLAVTAILVPVVLYDPRTPFPGLAALPPCLGTLALIWLHGERRTLVGEALAWRPVVFVGLISYSLYVWHWPIIVYDRMLFGDATPARAAACVLLSLAVAAASWAWIERPFRSRTGPLRTRGAVFAVSGASMAAVCLLAAALVAGKGWPARLPEEAARAFAATGDYDPMSRSCRRTARFGADDCRFGAPPQGKADFLLWGDSHAGAVLPGVEVAAERAGKDGFFVSLAGCAPLLGVDRIASDANENRCSDFNAAVMDFLRQRDDMPVVFLAGRWALSAEGVRPEEEGGDLLLRARDGGLPSGRVEDNFAVFEAGVGATVAAIRATGRRVVILGDAPEIGWPVPDRRGAELLWGLPMPPAPTAVEVAERDRRVDAAFRALETAPGVTFVPLAGRFCTPDCAVLDAEGRPLYVDDDHLSRTGAIALLPEPIFDAVWGEDSEARFAQSR